MIETIIINYLYPILELPVMATHQAHDPETFVIVERVGGGMTNRVRQATVAIQSYGPTMLAAAQLHERVLAAMEEIVVLDAIGACSLNSEYNYTDEATKHYRYQAVFDIVYY